MSFYNLTVFKTFNQICFVMFLFQSSIFQFQHFSFLISIIIITPATHLGNGAPPLPHPAEGHPPQSSGGGGGAGGNEAAASAAASQSTTASTMATMVMQVGCVCYLLALYYIFFSLVDGLIDLKKKYEAFFL